MGKMDVMETSGICPEIGYHASFVTFDPHAIYVFFFAENDHDASSLSFLIPAHTTNTHRAHATQTHRTSRSHTIPQTRTHNRDTQRTK